MIRIANGQGFWGDWLEAPVRLVDGGPIDYLTLDYLAEVTMSILQKQRQAGPRSRLCARLPPADRTHRRQTARTPHQSRRQCRRSQSRSLRASRPESRARTESRCGPGRRCAPPHRRVPRPRATRCAISIPASRSPPSATASSAPTPTSAHSLSPKPWPPAPMSSSPAAAPTPPWCSRP